MDEVADTGESGVITKRDKAVAELAPAKKVPGDIVGALKGWFKIMPGVDLDLETSEDGWAVLNDGEEAHRYENMGRLENR